MALTIIIVVFLVLIKYFWTFFRLKANAGALTNFEVLEFLRSRGAGKDTTRVIAPVAPSEYKVSIFTKTFLI